MEIRGKIFDKDDELIGNAPTYIEGYDIFCQQLSSNDILYDVVNNSIEMVNMKIKGVVFDMDGVLVDNMPIHIEAFDLFCQRFGGNDNWEDVVNNSVGMGNNEILKLMMPQEVIEKWGMAELARQK